MARVVAVLLGMGAARYRDQQVLLVLAADHQDVRDQVERRRRVHLGRSVECDVRGVKNQRRLARRRISYSTPPSGARWTAEEGRG